MKKIKNGLISVHNHSHYVDDGFDLQNTIDTMSLHFLLQKLFHMNYKLLFEFLACHKMSSLQWLIQNSVLFHNMFKIH